MIELCITSAIILTPALCVLAWENSDGFGRLLDGISHRLLPSHNPSPVKPLELESAKKPAIPEQPINPPVQQPDVAVLLERMEALVKENEAQRQSLESKDSQLAAKDQEIARLNARILELDPPKRQLFRRVDQ